MTLTFRLLLVLHHAEGDFSPARLTLEEARPCDSVHLVVNGRAQLVEQEVTSLDDRCTDLLVGPTEILV